jgi:hypothetical protein
MSECEISGFQDYECAHCLAQESPDPCDGLTIHRSIQAKFPGVCALDESHKISEEMNISLVSLVGDDSTKALGWVCVKCATRIHLLSQSGRDSDREEKPTNLGYFA